MSGFSNLNLLLFEMSGLEGSGNNLSVKTSPLLRTKYIDLRHLPLTMSGGHSKISETPESQLTPDLSTAIADILRLSSSISDFISEACEPRVKRELEDTESSGKVTDGDEELCSDC